MQVRPGNFAAAAQGPECCCSHLAMTQLQSTFVCAVVMLSRKQVVRASHGVFVTCLQVEGFGDNAGVAGLQDLRHAGLQVHVGP